MVAERRPPWVLSGLRVSDWKVVLGVLGLVESGIWGLVEVRVLELVTLWVLIVQGVPEVRFLELEGALVLGLLDEGFSGVLVTRPLELVGV